MPVNYPSYFGAPRAIGRVVGSDAGNNQTGNHVFLAGTHAGDQSAADDLIIIGWQSGAGFHQLTNQPAGPGEGIPSNAIGTIIVGARSLSYSYANFVNGPSIFLGPYIAQEFGVNNPFDVEIGDNIMIGSLVMSQTAGTSGCEVSDNILMGTQVFQTVNPLAINKNIVMGWLTMQEAGLDINMQDCVVIGALACNSFSGATHADISRNVYVGDSVSQSHAIGNDNVVVGQGSDTATSGNSNTLLGGSIQSNGGPNGTVGIGFGAIILADHELVIEVKTVGGLLYGNFATGCLVAGNSASSGPERNLFGTNTFKLLNGALGANPVGGGYFYVSAGALHWVGSAGTDSVIAPA